MEGVGQRKRSQVVKGMVAGMEDIMTTLQDGLAVSYKIKHAHTMWHNSHTPWHFPKGMENLRSHKYLHVDVYSSFIHNGQNLKVAKMSFRSWMDK